MAGVDRNGEEETVGSVNLRKYSGLFDFLADMTDFRLPIPSSIQQSTLRQ